MTTATHTNGNGTRSAAQSAAPPRQTKTKEHGGPNEVLRFDPDAKRVQHIVAFETMPETAVEVEGKYGMQWRYFLQQNRMIYADAKLHQAITEALTQEDDGQHEWLITRTKNGRNNAYTVERIGEDDQDTQAADWNPEQYEAEAAALARSAPAPARNPGEAAAKRAESHRAESGTASALLKCYVHAIDLAAHAVEHAKQRHGLLLTPAFEDIRAMAATLFIQSNKESK